MIVSGFTQKSVEVEHSHGSPLDHSHCVTCVNRACKVPANYVTSCDVINCPRGCHNRYHGCKEYEHLLLCPEERVACINNVLGCPAVIHRKKLADHLATCPASIVHCRAEWNRLHIDAPARQGEKRAVVMKKSYTDCGQLDTALAMRDHRSLVDRLLSPQQTAAKSPSQGFVTHSSAPVQRLPSSSSDLDVSVDLLLRWDTSFQQLKKKAAASCQPAALPSSASHCAPGQAESINGETGMDTPPTSSERGQAGCCRDEEKACEALRDGQALDSVVSLNLNVECIARCQPKASDVHTFLCAQDVRRDEFPHHFHTVHDRIQSDLNGWMEQRCPLAYLGCPFSFRRFRPDLPDMTLRHSWLLESLGVTAQSPQADFSHQTPLHLLPTFAEAADGPHTSAGCNGPLQASHGLPLGKSVGCGRLEHDPGSSPASSQNCHSLKGKSLLQRQREESATPLVSSELPGKSETSDKVPFSNPSPSGCLQNSQPAEDSCSSLLDSITLEEGSACVESNLTESQTKNSHLGNATHPPSSVSGQASQVFNQDRQQVGSAENAASKAQSQSHQENIRNVSSTLPSRLGSPPSFSSSTPVEGRQVIYTGLNASSRVRIDSTSTWSAWDSSGEVREVKTSQCPLQLGDLPLEVVRYVTQFLDSFSLYNLSLASTAMRGLCCTLLQDRGMVALVWARQLLGDAVTWRVVGKRWSFSTCFDPVESWRFTGHNPLANHLLSCPYNQDRLRHTQPFSIIPSSETPLNIQIRDMLQDLLQRRRDFRGWIIHSNFERELITEARPMEGSLAGVLVALGGTLPQ